MLSPLSCLNSENNNNFLLCFFSLGLGNKTSGFECQCVKYDNQCGVVLAIYDMVIIKHYFASGILACISTHYYDY